MLISRPQSLNYRRDANHSWRPFSKNDLGMNKTSLIRFSTNNKQLTSHSPSETAKTQNYSAEEQLLEQIFKDLLLERNQDPED